MLIILRVKQFLKIDALLKRSRNDTGNQILCHRAVKPNFENANGEFCSINRTRAWVAWQWRQIRANGTTECSGRYRHKTCNSAFSNIKMISNSMAQTQNMNQKYFAHRLHKMEPPVRAQCNWLQRMWHSELNDSKRFKPSILLGSGAKFPEHSHVNASQAAPAVMQSNKGTKYGDCEAQGTKF